MDRDRAVSARFQPPGEVARLTSVPNIYGTSIAITSDAIYVAGLFVRTAEFSGMRLQTGGALDDGNGFVAKYGNDLKLMWVRGFGGEKLDQVESMSVSSSGDVYLTGRFWSSTVDFGGPTLSGNGQATPFLVQFDAAGTAKWAKPIGGSDVKALVGGGIVVSGDPIFGRYTSDGMPVWERRQYTGYLVGVRVAADSSGQVFVLGEASNAALDGNTFGQTGGRDVFAAKLTSTGGTVWAKSFGGTGTDVAHALDLDPAGNVYVLGSYAAGFQIDGDMTMSQTEKGFFVGRLESSNGKANWAFTIPVNDLYAVSPKVGSILYDRDTILVSVDFIGTGTLGQVTVDGATGGMLARFKASVRDLIWAGRGPGRVRGMSMSPSGDLLGTFKDGFGTIVAP
jgi:hypothetical protein